MASVPLIRYGGNSIIRQPYAIQEVRGCGFAVEGDADRLQTLCDLVLNLPDSPARYRVLSPTVLFTFMHMGRLTSTVPADAARGFFMENELNVTVLLAAGREEFGIFFPERLVWWMPYLWLDSSGAMIAGRDVYGFPKQYGEVLLPVNEGEPAQFSAAGEVLHTFHPHTAASIQPIVRAWRTDAPNLEFEPSFLALDDAASAFFAQAFRVTDPLLLLWTAAMNLTSEDLLKLVFLRQLPSVTNSMRACFQSIIEAPFHLTRFGGAGFLSGDYALEIFDHASAPLIAELGLSTAPGTLLVTPELSYFVDIDFVLESGQEIWVAP